MNEYLIKKYSLKLPSDSNNKEDIFRVVNAINNPDDKYGEYGVAYLKLKSTYIIIGTLIINIILINGLSCVF
ncbi:hypothetical protein [Clostridium botulinum]|uniref:Uncharacterized protein n=2 Tax=Clostridium botulinum TaxID=1491 RepID=C1FPU7_CLOBJ|nr:hypothetical protein [Clostridium botulinum]AJD28844.1 hypothetical protein T257_3404 [Clostridium botulinum CDC_297]EKN42075.1 hypothetical protein CFSAN001627_09192 [Clostridium botulinum CFSAN001627]ACO84836.1 hypothetical protein CLM_2264 [Clostridium botulinum A2 str. Kyoto]APC83923.1 hypothetical protein NPD12_2203 [Clostridium botulinum]AUN03581.1 hypothetical protein RSJ19_11885 [Clostridium botulinum]